MLARTKQLLMLTSSADLVVNQFAKIYYKTTGVILFEENCKLKFPADLLKQNALMFL